MERVTIDDLKEGASVSDMERIIINRFIDLADTINLLFIGTCTGYTIAKIREEYPHINIDTVDYIPNDKEDNYRCIVDIKNKSWSDKEHNEWRGLKKKDLLKYDEKFRKYLKDNNIANITLHTNGSDNFFKNNSKKYEFIFIDGDHIYEVAKRDLNNSLECMNEGIIIMHDIKFLDSCKFWGDKHNTCFKVFADYEGDKEFIGTENNLGVIYV